jgi:hypothetical protein
MLVVLLLGLLLLREPRFQPYDDLFLRWLLKYSKPGGGDVPLTVVEIGRDPLMETRAPDEPQTPAQPAAVSISPLEFALFLQSVMEFQPEVIAFENILRWRDRDRDQEQVFLDQAMRVPKLLLGAELTRSPDPDDQEIEIHGFPQVKGKRGDLMEFSGVGRRPVEDLRLISTIGFVNLPDEVTSDLRVPLLFLYRGEVVPSFTLQAIMLWLRITTAEVKVEIGSHIELPDGRKIRIGSDGTALIHPGAAQKARRLSLNELLLATQEREAARGSGGDALDLRGHIVLARTPANPLAPPDVFTATLASVQGNVYLRRMTRWFDCAVLVLAVCSLAYVRRVDRADLVLIGIAATAAYCMIALAVISRWHLWLPGTFPLGAMWLVILPALMFRKKTAPDGVTTVTVPTPVP